MQAEAARLRDLVQTLDKAQEVGEPETQGPREGPQETPVAGRRSALAPWDSLPEGSLFLGGPYFLKGLTALAPLL